MKRINDNNPTLIVVLSLYLADFQMSLLSKSRIIKEFLNKLPLESKKLNQNFQIIISLIIIHKVANESQYFLFSH